MAEPQKQEPAFADLAKLLGFPDSLIDVPLREIERAAIVMSMRRHKSTAKVAKLLGVSVRKIQYRVARYRREGWL